MKGNKEIFITFTNEIKTPFKERNWKISLLSTGFEEQGREVTLRSGGRMWNS